MFMRRYRMVIKDSDIELILQRVNVSYAEAEKALIKSKGDLNRAIRYLEKKESSFTRRLFSRINLLFLNLVEYQIIISRKDEKLINIPLVFMIIFFTFFARTDHIKMIMLFLLIILTDCKISIHKKKKVDKLIKNQADESSPKTDQANDITTTLEVIEEDDYNEIYVEN